MVGIASWGKQETGCKAAVHIDMVQDTGVVRITKDGFWNLIPVHMKERSIALYASQGSTGATVVTEK